MDQETTTPGALATEITVNGHPMATRAATLAAFIAEQGYGVAKVATAVNGDFVPERARGVTALRAGDRVEIVSARQGG
jgi:sulfur carrier protein